ncbi:MAG: hypothetical protein QOH41_242 [Blastocatellia bacterium]|jgi:VWFA-related protein|nr:hypothetical protein [Blastocatellia bacterium]
MNQRHLLAVVLLTGLLHPLQSLSQTPNTQKPTKPAIETPVIDEQDVLKINTNLVQLDAVVTRNGKQVTDLRAEDFVIFQDGKPQAITNFSYVSNVPVNTETVAAPEKTKRNSMVPPVPVAVRPHDVRRTMAFVVDDLGSAFDTMYRIRKQMRKFINEDLSPNDLVAIIRTGGEVGALQQFTTDKRVLLRTVEQLRWNPCSRAGVSFFSEVRFGHCGIENYGDTLMSLQYIVSGMSTLPGRKSMVVMSDSMPVDDREPGVAPASAQLPPGAAAVPSSAGSEDGSNYQLALHRLAELAIRSSVVVYAVDTRGLIDTFPSAAVHFNGPASGPGSIHEQVSSMMRESSDRLFRDRQGAGIIAKETGGLLFDNSNDFGLKKVVEDQQGYYLIGFRPAGETFDRSFHHITIKVKTKGLAVRTRTGFFGVTDEEARKAQQASLKNINAVLASPFGVNDITVRLTTLFANGSKQGSILRSFIYVNARDLSFTGGPNGSHVAAFDVDSILFGDNGRPVYQRSQTASLDMNEQQYQRTLREGVIYDFEVPVKKPGGFQFRVAVRDHDSAHIGTAAQFVEVPDLSKHVLTVSSIVVTPDASTETGPSTADSERAAQDRFAVPGSRTFRQGSGLMFGYAIYNARLDQTTHLPRLTSQTRIFRNGKLIYTGESVPLSAPSQADLQRIAGGGRLLLGPDFPVGEYVLQIIVTDNLANPKQGVSAQWVDFEIVK